MKINIDKLKGSVSTHALPYILALVLLGLMAIGLMFSPPANSGVSVDIEMVDGRMYTLAGYVNATTAQVNAAKTYIYSAVILLKRPTSSIAILDSNADTYANARPLPCFEYVANSTPANSVFVKFDRPLALRNGFVIEASDADVRIYYQEIN